VFWSELIAGCVVDGDGDYPFDSADGRAFLLDPKHDLASLMRLVLPCLEFNGVGARAGDDSGA
jgi:hypothetical protein